MNGFWISPKFQVIPVYDHLLSVQESPKKFGLTKKQFLGMKARGFSREEVLLEVLKKGWIRVRGHFHHTSFEGWGRADDIIAGVLIWAKKEKAWDEDRFLINNLKNQTQLEITYGELKEKFAYSPNPKFKFRKIYLWRDLMPEKKGERCEKIYTKSKR
jgi:hypothetical protein